MEYLTFSAPGRVELGGNHTDHQHGCVLAAAIDRTARARVRPTGEGVVRVFSRGYAPVELAPDDLSPRQEERNTTAALVRGMAAAFRRRGLPWRGFDAWVESDVLPGSGLSSSAAFEVLLGRIGNALFAGNSLTAADIARMGQWAENVYFGKPCGLMDQLASSTGGLVFMDFRDPAAPLVRRLDAALPGYVLCVVDSGADHVGLTEAYAAIPRELGAVCRLFGAEVLRQVEEAEFYRRLPEVRRAAGDRAVLRAIHVFDENRRVLGQVQALENGDTEGFLALVNDSGRSSWEYLQNIAPEGAAGHQELAVTLALCRRLLRGRGAVRVHGGGFAGTALCMVRRRIIPPSGRSWSPFWPRTAATGCKSYKNRPCRCGRGEALFVVRLLRMGGISFFQMGDDDAGAAQYKHRQHQREIQNRAIHQIG